MNENPGKIVKEMFNLKKSNNIRIKELINNIPMPEIDTQVGKPVKIDDRTIYPIIRTYVTIGKDFAGIEIFPIALVIEESEDKYAISLIDEEINPEELFKMI
jgi:uncharacterized spore protein YtfJ